MPIKQNRYVDIASAVIGASAVPMRKLIGRLFSTNPKIPAGKVLEFASGQVDELLARIRRKRTLPVSISAMLALLQ
ncbi:Uncharacterised protein [Providencia alcalifaciens]|nr:Uncharacterised protein [Providencia alcalifaciens]